MKIKGNIENKGKGGKGWWLEGVVAKGGGGGGGEGGGGGGGHKQF